MLTVFIARSHRAGKPLADVREQEVAAESQEKVRALLKKRHPNREVADVRPKLLVRNFGDLKPFDEVAVSFGIIKISEIIASEPTKGWNAVAYIDSQHARIEVARRPGMPWGIVAKVDQTEANCINVKAGVSKRRAS